MIQFPCGVCSKAVGDNHRAIEGALFKTWIHIKLNKFDQNDYKFYKDNPDKCFFCIKCSAENIAFASLNDDQFEICVNNGINYLPDTDISFKPSDPEQRLFNKLNNAINSIASCVVQEDNEENNDLTIDCNYYSLDEFTSAKFNSSKTFSIVHLNIHSIEKHIEEFRVILTMIDFKFDIICLSEIKIQKDCDPKNDINIDIC